MKVLFINGSPRRHGLIEQMLELIRQSLPDGNESDWVQVSELDIRPCTGCMVCRTQLKCTLPEDDAQRVLAKIQQADALVIGSPCYWGSINGHLKMMFDRMVYGMMGETKRGIPVGIHKGKKVILVATCTTMYPFNIWFHQSRGVIKALREILKWSGFKIVGTLEKGGTKTCHTLSKREIYRCKRLARKLKD